MPPARKPWRGYLGERKPKLMVTDPPYGIELDSEWRDRAGLNTAPGQKRTAASKAAAKANPQYAAEPSYMKHRTEGHTETTISGDTPGRLVRGLRTGAEPAGRVRLARLEVHARGSERPASHRLRASSADYLGQGADGPHADALLVSA